MTNYVIINGVNSNTINGLGINELPPITKPLQRSLIEEIDGRDGDIITKLGYGAYDKTMTIGLFHTYDIDEVIAFFNGEGTITFSNEPDKVYYFTILDQIDYEKLINFKTATITLHCQPFKYPIEETPIEVAYQYVEGEGESITLENTAEAQMQLDLLGNTQQDSTTGKNLAQRIGGYLTADGTFKTSNDDSFYFPVTQGETYTYNATGNRTLGAIYDNIPTNNATPISGTYSNNMVKNSPFTASATGIMVIYANTPSSQDTINSFIAVKGNVIGDYEPYTNGASPNPDYPQQIHTCSGDNTIKVEGKNLYSRDNGQYNVPIYAPDGTSASYQDVNVVWIKVSPNTGYSFTLLPNSTAYYVRIIQCDSNKGFIVRETQVNSHSTNIVTTTKTTRSNCEWLQIGINQYATAQISQNNWEVMVEKSSTPTTYEPYTSQSHLISLGDIELCKIGTYQDKIYKDNGKWYLHKEIYKKTITESDTFSLYNKNSNRSIFYFTSDENLYSYTTQNITSEIVSSHFTPTSQTATWAIGNVSRRSQEQNAVYMVVNPTIETTEQFTDYIKNKNIKFIIPLLTPTNTEITDSTLLEALENIYSMTGTTNITQENNDLAMFIKAKALMQGSGTATINNIGNVYSKPNLDIVGNGVVNVAINGNQLLSVNVTDEIVIDSTNLEAYNPTTHELMNRQVTGNIANIKLDPGENTLTISGDLDTATITNYVRWL